ncbi:MAG: class I SAM-dependent methyltransferase, partial [Ignavibacteriaceae bacterium]
KYDVQYFRCKNCEYIFTEEPYWLEEAYKHAINIFDTGILDRNLHFRKLVSILIYFFYVKRKKFLDYAGGYGIFTRLMRDTGFDFCWDDPFCENIMAKGFEYNPNEKNRIQLLTAFEVFEHLVNPVNELEKMLEISKSIVFSTELVPVPLPMPDEWWYYAFEHGQHISFYSKKTLVMLANKFNLNFYNYNNLFLFTDKNISRIVFNSMMSLNKIGLYMFVKKVLKSKTMEDHFALRKNFNEHPQ